MVLVHGLGSCLAVWGKNIHPLAETHTVYALDLPGHGKSDKPKSFGYDAVSGAHSLNRFMDTLGISSATLMGNSAGGLMTATSALTYPQRLDKLVLVDTAGLGRQMAWFLRLASIPLVGELLHITGVRSTDGRIKSLFYEPRPANDNLVNEVMESRNTTEVKTVVLKGLRSGATLWGLRKSMMVLQELKNLPMPLLIIWGQEDRIMPVSHAYQAQEVLPNGTVHVIPRCGHWPQMERPDLFNPLVLSFLEGASDGESGTI